MNVLQFRKQVLRLLIVSVIKLVSDVS